MARGRSLGPPGLPVPGRDRPRRPSSSRAVGALAVAIVSVVVAAVLIVSLLVAGVLPGLYPSGNGKPSATFAVRFTETGLPNGTSWTVSLGDSNASSNATTISFEEPNGAYHFSVRSLTGYYITPGSGEITVNGSAVERAITFEAIPPKYPVTFSEAGLAAGTAWSVTLNGATVSSSSSAVLFERSNGTYSFAVGNLLGFTASPSSGVVTVAGAPISQTVRFTPVASTYTVMFAETGLSPGAVWSANLSGHSRSSTQPTIAFTGVPDGFYSFSINATGYVTNLSSGFVVVNGGNVTQPVSFLKSSPSVQFLVRVIEQGLPIGYSWSLMVGSAFTGGAYLFLLASENTIEFTVPNGTYDIDASGFSSTLTSVSPYQSVSNFTVHGGPVDVALPFRHVLGYPVTFTESGLANGTLWSVLINSTDEATTAPTLTLYLTNGTYPFSAFAVDYAAQPPNGTVVVDGAPVNESVRFVRSSYSLTFTQTGLASNAPWRISLKGPGTNETYFVIGSEATFSDLANGTYTFSVQATNYSAAPANGTLTVQGADVVQPIVFTPLVRHGSPITFAEHGLGNRTVWYVFLGSAFLEANATGLTSLTLYVPNGTYGWSVFASGYAGTPASGVVTVNGSNVTVTIAFTLLGPDQYLIIFVPALTGSTLPSSAQWNVTVNGVTQEVAGGLLVVFVEPNGTARWTISAPAGFAAYGAAGSVNISGGLPLPPGTPLTHLGAEVLFPFVPLPSPVSPSPGPTSGPLLPGPGVGGVAPSVPGAASPVPLALPAFRP